MDFSDFHVVLLANIDKDMSVEFDFDAGDIQETLAIGRGLRGLGERSFKVVHRGRQRHFISCIHFGIELISEHVVEALKCSNAKGWDIFPATIKGGEDRPKFYGLVVPSSCGPERADQLSAACRPHRGRKGEVFPVFFGRYFDPSRWDGSDIFRFENQATIIVHRKILAEFRRRKIRIYAATRLDHAESMRGLLDYLDKENMQS